MSDYSIISDISGSILALLRNNIQIEHMPSTSIKLASPNDQSGDLWLGVYLYDIKELSEYRLAAPKYSAPSQKHARVRTRSPTPFSLHYLIFQNTKVQTGISSELEQQVFGKVLQTLEDSPAILQGNRSHSLLTPSLTLSMSNMGFEEKTKIWSALQLPYQLGFFFCASPVFLASAIPPEEVPCIGEYGLEAMVQPKIN